MEENKKTSKEILPESDKMENDLIKAKTYISQQGYGVGTNYTTNLVAVLLANYLAENQKEIDTLTQACYELSQKEYYQIELLEEADDKISNLKREVEEKDKVINGYATAARVIHLHLKDYCNEDLSYDEMIAGASRLAAKEISSLKREIEHLKKQIKTNIPEFLYVDEGELKTGVHGDSSVTELWNNYVKSLLIS